MFISIDAKKCMGHGRCYTAAPDLLSEDDEGFVAQSGQTLAIPEGLLDQAHEAAEACPEGAITVRQTSAVDA
jgi:ferredoxin